MTVKELIEMLEMEDPNANVLLAIQPNYPFEHDISHVICRNDALEPNEKHPGTRNDVFICDGGQIRYADNKLFNWTGMSGW